MKWKIAFSVLALSLATQASADEHRGGDAALGALSGAVVLGPIGAVAGAVVGYTAGPSIAHAWGFRRGGTPHQRPGVDAQRGGETVLAPVASRGAQHHRGVESRDDRDQTCNRGKRGDVGGQRHAGGYTPVGGGAPALTEDSTRSKPRLARS